jgi:hypothetical protein
MKIVQKDKVEGEDLQQSKQSWRESQQPYKIFLVKIIIVFIGSKCISLLKTINEAD